MKNAIIAAVVAALVSSGATYAGTSVFQTRTSIVRSGIVSVAPGGRGFATATCRPGAVATGGGITSSDIAGPSAVVTDSAPAPLTGTEALGWTVSAQNPTDSIVSIQAYAVCVK